MHNCTWHNHQLKKKQQSEKLMRRKRENREKEQRENEKRMKVLDSGQTPGGELGSFETETFSNLLGVRVQLQTSDWETIKV